MKQASVDEKVLNELRAGVGDEFLVELIDTYCVETPQLLVALQAMLAAGDAAEFGRIAHSIKSSSATFGALELAAQARALEAIGRAGDLSAVGDGCAQLAAGYALVEQALRGWQHGA